MKHISKGTLVAVLCLAVMLCLFPALTKAETEYVTVTFDANGGYFGSNTNRTTGSVQAVKGAAGTDNGRGCGIPSRDGYAYVGWCLNAAGTGEVYTDPWDNFTPTYTKDTTLYAKWEKWNSSGTCGENLTWSFDASNGKLTIAGSGAMEDFAWLVFSPWYPVKDQITSVSLPSGLTYIGKFAFCDCSALTALTIPAGITGLGNNAFSGCSGLTSVTINTDAAGLNGYSFSGCSKLETFKVSSGNKTYAAIDGVLFSADKKTLVAYPPGKTGNSYTVPNGVQKIGDKAFWYCKNVTSVILPSGLTTIGRDAFNSCSKLASINIPNSVTVIEMEAFCWCKGLTSITIPNSVVKIGHYAFADCTGLTSFTIPASVTTIGGSPFAGCTGLTEIKVDSNNRSFAAVNGVLFSYDKKTLVAYPAGKAATSYTVPSGVTTIGSIAFQGSPNLTSVVIPDGVTSIGNSAFAWCENLGSVTLPATVKFIGYGAFSNLTNVYYKGSETQKAEIEISDYNDDLLNATWHYQSGGTVVPTITGQPSSVTKDLGATATFKVTATGAESYQWQYQKPGDATWYDVQNNGKSATFNQTNVAARHNGFVFRCKVTNAIGSVYSNTAKLTVPTTAPTITSHPAAVTKDLGTTATFKVVATGATSYQWQYQKPGSSTWYDVQNNGKSATFSQTNLEKRHNGFVFRCKVSNGIGSVFSNSAKLTVPTTAPTISSHPASVTKDLGATATFKVTAANATSYQWQYQKPGNSTWYDVQNNGKSATFNQTNLEKRHNGFVFRCKVTNAIGSVYSNTAKLTVITTAPTITSHPASVTKDLGTTATFKVTAANATSYQWQYQKPGNSTWYDVQVDGKSATFNQTNVAARHNGFVFRCKVTNGVGSVYSNTAKLTVPTTAPTISSHPASVTKDLGTTATFTVAASNATSYQWQYQIPGSSTWNDVQNNGKSATFNQTNVEKRHNGYLFRCKVTNGIGSVISNSAKLTVATTAPTISSQPSNVTATLGSTATFKVTSANATSYQWQYQKPGDSTWYDVQNNGKSATFNQTNVALRHNGFVFRCKVTNALGTAYSNTAKLTVN